MKKRISVIFIIFILMFSIVGCKNKNNNNNNNNNQTETDAEKIERVLNSIILPSETKDHLTLPKEIEGVSIRWDSDKTNVLSNEGKIRRSHLDQDIRLKAYLTYNNEELFKLFNIKVLRYSDAELLQMVFENLDELPESTEEDLYLQSEFDYGVVGVWSSSNEKIISTTGVFKAGAEDEVVVLTIKLTLGEESMEKDYEVSTKGIGALEEVKYDHLVLQYANEFNPNNYNNVVLNNYLKMNYQEHMNQMLFLH